MSNSMPFVKWHGRDWLGDPLLRMVGPEVRGVWIDILCAMMNAEPYGHLAVNGRPMSDEQAARLTGTDIGTFKAILKEIEDAGISSRTDGGMLFSRRLVRDYERFMKASEFGKRGGGNPKLNQNTEEKQESRDQKPEARGALKVPFKGTYKGIVIPECLATVEGFADAFAAWVEFRSAKRAKATERVKATILKRLSERPEQAVAALDTCMAAGWTDVRWDWIDNRNRATAHTGDPRNAKPGGFYDSGSEEDAWPELTAAERRAAELEGKAK